MVNIYNIRILKLPRGRHDVCESSRVLISHSFFWGGWVKGGGGTEDATVVRNRIIMQHYITSHGVRQSYSITVFLTINYRQSGSVDRFQITKIKYDVDFIPFFFK